MYLFFNNTLETEENFKVSLSNRAFNYGDGLFETMISRNNIILYLEDHLNRFKEGMKALSIEIPEFLSKERISEVADILVNKNNISGLARVKIQAYRKPGGLFTPTSREAEVLITVVPGQAAKEVKTQTYFFNDIKLYSNSISRFKTCNALPYILAGMAGQKLNADDMILTDTEDQISECISSNIFWIKNDAFFTPSLETGCIDGIKRKQIINFLREHRINLKEGKFSKRALLEAELIFTCNVTGISVIEKIEGKIFRTRNDLYEGLKRI